MIKEPDIEYFDGSFFTLFVPRSKQGVIAWNELAAQTDGTGKTLYQHRDDTIKQLRAAGYVVRKGTPSNAMSDTDFNELLEG